MMKRLTFTALALCAVVAFAFTANAQTAADIHGDPGCAPSAFDGAAVSLTGVVYVQPGTYNSGSTYFQTANGGLLFYESGNPLVIGDEIMVDGTVGAFGDEIQLNGAIYTLLSSGNTPVALPFGTGDLADGTNELANFISVTGVLAEVSIGFNSVFTVDDGTGPCLVFVDGTTAIDIAAVQSMVGDIVSVQGASKCYLGEGELLPRMDSDIQLVTVATDEASMGEVKARF